MKTHTVFSIYAKVNVICKHKHRLISNKIVNTLTYIFFRKSQQYDDKNRGERLPATSLPRTDYDDEQMMMKR